MADCHSKCQNLTTPKCYLFFKEDNFSFADCYLFRGGSGRLFNLIAHSFAGKTYTMCDEEPSPVPNSSVGTVQS